MQDRKTLVVNLFAGPSAGKTTCAWEIAAALKKKGVVTEYVPEYAKEFVWDGNAVMLDGSYKSQNTLLETQTHRIERLIGKVDVVVTDAPLLLNPLYAKERVSEIEEKALSTHKSHNTFNLFINRGNSFEREGRIHSEIESRKLDEDVHGILKRNNIFYGTYSHQQINLTVSNIQKTLSKLQGLQEKGQIQYMQQQLSQRER